MTTATSTRVLFVAWQEPATRAFHTVGRLVYGVGPDGDEYEFAYVRGVYDALRQGFRSFRAFPGGDLSMVYRSRELFPFFANRLMSRKRPDYPGYLRRLGLKPGEDDPMTVLGRSGGARVTDDVELFPMPEGVPSEDWGGSCYQTYFFAHGLRHLTTAEQQRTQQLRAGEKLVCRPEPQNPADPYAVLLLTVEGIRAGYVPRYLAPDTGELFQVCTRIEIAVQQLNSPATPASQRLLCRMRTCWPDGFRPFAGSAYQPIAERAAVVRVGPA